MSRISLLLQESKVKPGMNINNNDILQVQWDICNLLISQRTVPISV